MSKCEFCGKDKAEPDDWHVDGCGETLDKNWECSQEDIVWIGGNK